MSSQILSIYDSLVALSFTVSGSTVTAKDINETPNSVDTAGMPVRMLAFMDIDIVDNTITENILGAGVGGAVTPVTWTIVDRLFIESMARTIGQRSLAVAQAQYIADYIDALRDDSTLAGYSAVNASMAASGRPINYPAGSDRWYYGVTIVLTVQEKF